MRVLIDIIGDPMVDLWLTPNQWIATPGGAYNVLKNIQSLVKDNDQIEVRSVFYELDESQLVREASECGFPCKIYHCDKKWKAERIEDSVAHSLSCESAVVKDWLKKDNTYSILVVSDYRKGFVTKNLHKLLEGRRYNVIIVDSRYGNTDFKLLRLHCDELVWRKTNTDQDVFFEWDVKIESYGTGTTKLTIDNWVDDCSTIEIPIDSLSETVCSTGCGDTFTATIAASLAYLMTYFVQGVSVLKHTDRDFKWMIENAHKCCQEVVGQPRTSIVTNFKLK